MRRMQVFTVPTAMLMASPGSLMQRKPSARFIRPAKIVRVCSSSSTMAMVTGTLCLYDTFPKKECPQFLHQRHHPGVMGIPAAR